MVTIQNLMRILPAVDEKSGGGVQLKRSLAERLGRVVDEEEPLMSPQKGEYHEISSRGRGSFSASSAAFYLKSY